MSEVRKYRVKTSWIFNLESMHDKIWCLIYDIQDGKISCPFEVAGTKIEGEDDLFSLMEECDELCWTAQCKKVTGREYGRIKQIVEWRVMNRYLTCMNNGMSESDAGVCFADM